MLPTRLIRLTLTLLTPCLLLACNINDGTTTLRVAHTLDTHHPVHKGLEYMDERLSHHSKGTMRLALYPSGQLGSEREVIELLQIGSLSMTKVSASSMEAFVPEMKVFGLPYLFNNSSHFWNILNGDIGQQLLDAGVPFRIRGLGYFDAGSRSFYSTKKQIKSPADLPGMKIRVLSSPMAIAMVKAMGGSATPISWGELYTSLQTGVIDALEWVGPYNDRILGFHEVAKYYYYPGWHEPGSILEFIINKDSMAELPADLQAIVREAARASSQDMLDEYTARNNEALRELIEEHGVQLRRFRPPCSERTMCMRSIVICMNM